MREAWCSRRAARRAARRCHRGDRACRRPCAPCFCRRTIRLARRPAWHPSRTPGHHRRDQGSPHRPSHPPIALGKRRRRFHRGYGAPRWPRGSRRPRLRRVYCGRGRAHGAERRSWPRPGGHHELRDDLLLGLREQDLLRYAKRGRCRQQNRREPEPSRRHRCTHQTNRVSHVQGLLRTMRQSSFQPHSFVKTCCPCALNGHAGSSAAEPAEPPRWRCWRSRRPRRSARGRAPAGRDRRRP